MLLPVGESYRPVRRIAMQYEGKRLKLDLGPFNTEKMSWGHNFNSLDFAHKVPCHDNANRDKNIVSYTTYSLITYLTCNLLVV